MPLPIWTWEVYSRTFIWSGNAESLSFSLCSFRNRHPDGHEFQGAECKLSGSERTGIYDFSRTDHHLCGRYSGAMGIRLGGVWRAAYHRNPQRLWLFQGCASLYGPLQGGTKKDSGWTDLHFSEFRAISFSSDGTFLSFCGSARAICCQTAACRHQ